jgi:hypothetical protein
MNLPLAEKYVYLLKDLRFGYMNMKDGTSYKHHYTSHIVSNINPP